MKKCNALVLFVVLYVVFVIFLVLIHPFVASAAEKELGGVNNKASVSSVVIFDNGTKNIVQSTFQAKDDYEIVGYLTEQISSSGTYYELTVQLVKNGSNYQLNVNKLSDYVGYSSTYEDDELKSSNIFSMSTGIQQSNFIYKGAMDDRTITCLVSGMKVFSDREHERKR